MSSLDKTFDLTPTSTPPSLPVRLWNWLTQVNPALTGIEQRRQSKLLAIIIVVILMTTTLAVFSFIARALSGYTVNPTILGSLIPAQLMTVGVYAINRSGRYQLAAYLFIGLNFGLVHFIPLALGTLDWLLFGAMLMILSAILMPTRFTIGLFAVSVLTQIVIGNVQPLEARYTNFTATIVYLVTASLVIAFIVYRNGLEHERQAELKLANHKLRESEIDLERRVIERTDALRQAKEEAEAARLHAEQSDRIKSQFLASMSHELRTPLNAILTFNELMMMGTFGAVNDEQVEYLGKSLSSGRHLLSLINDVLDITKIHSGMMKLFIEADFNLAAELKTIVAAAEKLLAGKPVQIILDVDPQIPPLTCDKRRIRQVVYNLVSNAVKFTDSGSITLSAKKRGDELLLAVSDTGPGIDPQMQPLIFEPFVQTETGIKHSAGTGLGLPISKSLVEAHRGQLWVESVVGEGSAFYVLLPIQSNSTLGEVELITA